MNLISTGTDGLNHMLGGGYPENKIILICGGPGTGKTIISIQYLIEALQKGDSCAYFSMEEPIENIKEYVLSFEWDLNKYEKEGLLQTLDYSKIPYSDKDIVTLDSRKNEKTPFEIDLNTIQKNADIKHLVIDPISSILMHELRASRKRAIISKLMRILRNLKCNILLTTQGVPSEGEYYIEQFLADGVILLEKNIEDYKMLKTIRIDKMRGIDFDDQPRRYTITGRGAQVFYAEPVLI
jgi:circadian clock protein KaiC